MEAVYKNPVKVLKKAHQKKKSLENLAQQLILEGKTTQEQVDIDLSPIHLRFHHALYITTAYASAIIATGYGIYQLVK